MNIQVKNVLVYLTIAAAGVLIGWLLFGRAEKAATTHDHGVAEDITYTCSMHPQIRQKEKGKCPLCGMDLTPATSGASADSNPFVLQMTAEAVALANIQTVRVMKRTASQGITLSGKIRVNEEKRATITAKFPGRIERLFVNNTGQRVSKGERVANLYSPELINAQAELREAARSKDQNAELYEAAKKKLKLWKLTDQQIAQLEQADQPMTSFDIYSDVSGIVTERFASLGDYVSTGAVLAEVADLSTVWVVLDAYESDLAVLKIGMGLKFKVQGIPNREFDAKIAYITPMMDLNTRSVEVRAVVANQENLLKPELFVTASVQTSSAVRDESLAIPHTAVLWTGKRSVVYVKVKDAEQPSFEMREIQLGAKSGDYYQVAGGLQEGEEVVANGVFAVDGAAQLSGNYSMMTAPKVKTMEANPEFQKQLDGIIKAYFKLKDQLVASDATASAKSANAVERAIAVADFHLLSGEAKAHWQEMKPKMLVNAQKIATTMDLETQREVFIHLSDKLIEAVELFGTQQEVVYKSYCPMADNDEGAFWLSESKEIRNPYFGDAMLKCGEVRHTYRKGQRVFEDKSASQTGSQSGHQH